MMSEQQTPVEAAQAWAAASHSVAEAATTTWLTMASNAAEFWSLPATAMLAAGEAAAEAGRRAEQKPRSWYRKPPATPLDAMLNFFEPNSGAYGRDAMAWAIPKFDPFAVFGSRAWQPQSAAMMFAPFQPQMIETLQRTWSMLQLTMATAPMQRAMSDVAQAVTEATPGSAQYSAYRSEGGHAVAQVTLATMRVMALLLPTITAIATVLADSPIGMPPFDRLA